MQGGFDWNTRWPLMEVNEKLVPKHHQPARSRNIEYGTGFYQSMRTDVLVTYWSYGPPYFPLRTLPSQVRLDQKFLSSFVYRLYSLELSTLGSEWVSVVDSFQWRLLQILVQYVSSYPLQGWGSCGRFLLGLRAFWPIESLLMWSLVVQGQRGFVKHFPPCGLIFRLQLP